MSKSKLDQYREQLAIDPHNLDEMLCHQPYLFMEVADECAVSMSLRDQAKNTLSSIEADLQFSVREQLEEELGKKPTEAMVTAAIENDEDRQAAQTKYHEAKSDYDHWVALKEAYMQRGHALREMANLWMAGYHGQQSVQGSGRQEATERRAESNRTRLAEQRKESNGTDKKATGARGKKSGRQSRSKT